MPTLTREEIRKIAFAVMSKVGAIEKNASIVADHLADANMAGHDSHGIIRVPQYVQWIRQGLVDPAAEPEVEQDAGAIARIDGHHTFGQVAAMMATELAMEKAKEHGISLVSMGKIGHTGRIGTYPEIIAKAGMVGMFYTGATGPGGNQVAPFRGAEGRLGTNPISMAFPYTEDTPVLLDYATSASSAGKVRVYVNRKHRMADEWLLDKNGVPTDDPNVFYDDGVIIPFGGLTGGHKGFAMAFMVSLMGGALGSIGQIPDMGTARKGGSTVIAIDAAKLVPLDALREEVAMQVDHVKSARPLDPDKPVEFPGQYEADHRRERLEEGVDIEQDTWDQVVGSIKEFGLEKELLG